MKCEKIQPNLLDYSKGLLTGHEAEEVRVHLTGCAECALLLEEEAAFSRRLSAVGEEVPSNDVWALVRVQTKPRRLAVVGLLRALVASPVRRMTAIGAAAAILAVGLAVGPVQQPSQVTSTPQNKVVVKWSDDPLGNHTDAVIDAIDRM